MSAEVTSKATGEDHKARPRRPAQSFVHVARLMHADVTLSPLHASHFPCSYTITAWIMSLHTAMILDKPHWKRVKI